MSQPMHKKQKKPVNWGVFNDKELAEAIKKAEEGGGTGASTWNDVSGKPFETIGEGLTVTEGALSATGGSGSGGADWNAASGEDGFIANKPFDIATEYEYTLYGDMRGEEPLSNENKLIYFESISQALTHTAYFGVANVTDLPEFSVGAKFTMTYNGVEYEDTIVALENGVPITENYTALGSGTFEQPLFVGLYPMGGFCVLFIDDTLPAVADSLIDVSDYKLTGKTQLSGKKVKLGNGLYADENDSISVRATSSEIDSQNNAEGNVLTADGSGGCDWLPVPSIFPGCPIATDGTFKLQAVVSSGEVTYSWVSST